MATQVVAAVNDQTQQTSGFLGEQTQGAKGANNTQNMNAGHSKFPCWLLNKHDWAIAVE